MALRNSSIRNYFKPSVQPREAPVGVDRDERDSVAVDSIVAETTDGDHGEENTVDTGPMKEVPGGVDLEGSDSLEAVLAPESAGKQSSRDRVINGSDEEDSGSDSSVEDIYVALQHQSRPKYSNSAADSFKSPEKSRARNKRKRVFVQPSPLKPKYKFDMKTLIEQAEKHKATEASALSMKALLEDTADKVSQGNSPEAARDSILQSVLAEKEKDGADPGKFLLAVKRTEAIRTEKVWYFFDSIRDNPHIARPLPACTVTNGWKAMLADPQSREQFLLSGFARDMVALGDTLDEDLFRWMLDEICFEQRDDLREAYCKVLATMDDQLGQFMSHEVIKRLFQNLGAKKTAFDINEQLKLISKDQSPYEGHNWTILRAVISFIGRISKYLSTETSSYIMCVFTRLCIDSAIVEDISLLAAVQKSMEQVCSNIEEAHWETICQNTCASTFQAIKLPALQLQVLRCIPQTTRRVHELRRRLALAFFFEGAIYISNASHDTLDLSEVTGLLRKPKFTINKDTDYPELAAVMSILNIAIDNGLSFRHDATNPEGEVKFNREVDVLAARIKQIWGSINDAGAAFMSRSYAKEMMEGLRMRLELTIRTKPKPKLSIFETDEPDEDRPVLKQTTLSRKLFQNKSLDEGIV